jgi:hypothetical protein
MMPRPDPWTREIVAHLLRLDAEAASDPKITFSVMAYRLNGYFGTAFNRNAVAGKLQRLKAGTGYGAARQPRQKPPKAAEPQKRPERQPLKPVAAVTREPVSAPQMPAPEPETQVPQMPAPEPQPETPAPRQSRPARRGDCLPPQAPCQSAHVTLMERQPWQCGWPVNDGGPFLYCGAPKTGDPVYCDHHRAAATGRTGRMRSDAQ